MKKFFSLKFAFFILSFFLLSRFNIDPDFGWHLAYGRHFLETGSLVREDIFSWTMTGYLWGNYFSLYQVLVALIFSKLGYLFLGILFGLISAISVFIILPKNLDLGKFLVGLLGVANAMNLTVRPATISFLMMAFTMLSFEKNLFKRKLALFFYFVFFAIWANFHQGFVAGLLVLSGLLAFDFVQKRNLLRERILILIAGFTGSFVTPYHFRVWQGVLNDLFGYRTWTGIAEWKPIAVHFPANMFFLIGVCLFTFFVFKKFREFSPTWLLTACLVLVFTFLFTHFSIFWTLFFIFLMTRTVKLNLKGSGFDKLPAYFALSVISLVIFLSFATDVLKTLSLGSRLWFDRYPVEAVNFMKEKNLNENLYNDYSWGGYLIWQDAGKVFIDGRMTGWRNADRYILEDYTRLGNGDCTLLSKYEVKTVFVKATFDEGCFAGFAKVYEDEIAKILVSP